MPRIMFIWPGIYLGWGGLGKGFEQSSINHGLSSISAVLKDKGYPCFLVDMRSFTGWDHFETVLRKQNFDICLVGFHSVDTKTADRVVRFVKKEFPNKPIIVGGVHTTFNSLNSFSVADTVVWGEGDEVILDLLKLYEAKKPLPKQVTASRIKNVDALPHVDRCLFNSEFEKANPFLPLLNSPFYTINFSRGCNHRCSFCLESKNLLWKGQVIRSAENCVSEIQSLLMGTGGNIGSLMIHDDNFPSKKSWLTKFISAWDNSLPRIPWWCQMRGDAIVRNKDYIPELARLGMTWCSIGIEGSQRMLDFYNKKEDKGQIIEACQILHDNDINIFGNYIMGSPTETEEDIKELSEMLAIIKPEHHSSSTYTSYPGSLLYDYCLKNNLFVGDGKSDSDYYSLVRYPYERKIVGVDYDLVRKRQHDLSQNRGDLHCYVPKISAKKYVKTSLLKIDECREALPRLPRISIILLSHNRPAYLTEAIESVLKQTIDDWELIIIDDYSTDLGVLDVLKQAAKDPRIKVYRANYDVDNVSLLWNRGLDMALGKYIAFLDDDNHKKPTFCQEIADFLDRNTNFDAVSCFNETFTDDPQTPKTLCRLPRSVNKQKILIGNYIDSGNLVFRKEAINQIGWFDERLRTEDDWDFVIRLMYETKGIGLIEKPLAEYRKHPENRINRSNDLGFAVNREFIVGEKKYGKPFTVLVYHQKMSKITLSQNNVLRGVLNALKSIPWIQWETLSVGTVPTKSGYDAVLVFMPFSISIPDIERIQKMGKTLVTYQCEDPQALALNLQRAEFANYVFTNDISAINQFESVVGKGFCGYIPSISVDDVGLTFRDNVPKKYDVIFYGYAYASRIAFVKELQKICKVLPVGGGWKDHGFATIGELSEQQSINLMEESKIVIMYNRRNTDLGGNPESVRPQSVVRGYFEAASGSLIMLDDERKHHSFNGEVVFYSDLPDLVSKVDYFLNNENERESIGKRAKQRALSDFTYKTRVTKMMNAVRSMRYYYEVL